MTTQMTDDEQVWLGLNSLEDGYFWEWSDGTSFSYDYWQDSFPDPTMYGWHCVVTLSKSDNGRWRNSHCDQDYAYVCKGMIGDTQPKTDPTTPAVAGYCPQGYVSVPDSNKCFKVHLRTSETGRTWEESVNACRTGLGRRPDLASVANEDEMTLIKTQLKGSFGGVWIGLFREEEGGEFQWIDGSAHTYNYWAPYEPDTLDELCVEAWSQSITGQWNDANCEEKRGFVCQTYKESGAENFVTPSSYTVCQRADYRGYWYGCYKVLSNHLDWDTARMTCQAEGAELVSIHSEAENSHVKLATDQIGDQALWTGGRDVSGTGVYTWSDDWQFLYTRWDDGQPVHIKGGGCVLYQPNGTWTVANCQEHHPAMCKQTDIQSTNMETTSRSMPTTPQANETAGTTSPIETSSRSVPTTMQSSEMTTARTTIRTDDMVYAFSVSLKDDTEIDESPLPFDNILTNIGEGYSEISGVFTPPVAGLYFLQASIVSTEDTGFNVRVMKNKEQLCKGLAEDIGTGTATCTTIAILLPSDEVYVDSGNADLTDMVKGHGMSHFNGYLLQKYEN